MYLSDRLLTSVILRKTSDSQVYATLVIYSLDKSFNYFVFHFDFQFHCVYLKRVMLFMAYFYNKNTQHVPIQSTFRFAIVDDKIVNTWHIGTF